MASVPMLDITIREKFMGALNDTPDVNVTFIMFNMCCTQTNSEDLSINKTPDFICWLLEMTVMRAINNSTTDPVRSETVPITNYSQN
jgi:hypothetical protein